MLIDDVVESDQFLNEWPPGSTPNEIHGYFRNALVVRNQNVWDYYKLHMFGKENPNQEFPNVAPAAPGIWFEWVTDNAAIIDLMTDKVSKGRLKVGVICFAAELSGHNIEAASKEAWTQGMHIHADARWLGFGFIFNRILEPGKLPHMIGRVDWQVGHGGELLSSTMDGGFVYSLRSFYAKSANAEKLVTSILCAAQVCWLTLSFMHCKNVRITKGPPIPENLNRARERKGKHPLFRHHTVFIDPVRRVQEAALAGAGAGAAPALHFCRGHFKEFNERGLFGRHKGTYWWPMHARGSPANGIVSKDYLVRRSEP